MCPLQISDCQQFTAFREWRLSVTKDARVCALTTLLALLSKNHLYVRCGHVTRMAHALLSLAATTLTDTLDLWLWGGFVLSGLAWRVSDYLREVFVVAALSIESPDDAPGTLTAGLRPGDSCVKNH